MFRFLPDNTKFPFMRVARYGYYVSIVLGVLSIGLVAFKGLNYGVDFTGGVLVEARMPQPADLAAMRGTVDGLGIGNVQLQTFGPPTDVLLRLERQGGDERAQSAAVETLKRALNAEYGQVEYRRTEFVGPKVGDELLWDAVLAVLLSFGAVLLYIWFRFEWQFGVGAIVSLTHDIVLTLGLFSILGLEFDLSIVAALLTIVGYSLNDTVVVFDRMRENLRRFKRLPLADLIDRSINETLARTLMTGTTALLALLSLFIVGPAVISGFTFAMIWGVVIGTYSSIFIAAPVLIGLNLRPDVSEAGARPATQPGR